MFLPDGTFLPAHAVLATVDVARQRMEVAVGSIPVAAFPVSTARAGIGAEAGSCRTPPGWHRVAARYGSGAAPGQVFVSRRAVPGRVVPPDAWRDDGAADLILSRILRLEGLEPGVNRGGRVDSFARYIYLHGTNQEHLLGTPASHGCIRLANRDIIGLFTRAHRRPFYVRIVS